jgi:thiol-disulfide isomerase/thioredoxin
MKFFYKLLIVSILSLSLASADESPVVSDFDLPSKTGNVKLSDFKGKVIYLDFWASWCGPCKQSFPWMNAMQEKFKADGLVIVAVNLDTNIDDANKFLSANATNFTIAFDHKGVTPRIFSVKGMPSSFIINREGKIVFQHVGFNENEKNKLGQKLVEYLKAK